MKYDSILYTNARMSKQIVSGAKLSKIHKSKPKMHRMLYTLRFCHFVTSIKRKGSFRKVSLKQYKSQNSILNIKV